MKTWKFRQELLEVIEMWQSLLLFVIIGGLLGFFGSQTLHQSFQAEADMFVGIDVHRVADMAHVIPLAKTEPLNLDDYKNWQLKQVADITESDQILQDTLKSLKSKDSRWEKEALSDFRQRVEIYWFDAGTWRLQVTHSEKRMAEEAVKTWREVSQKKLGELVSFGEKAAEAEEELRIYVASLSSLKKEIILLEVFLDEIEEWEVAVEQEQGQNLLSETIREELQVWLRSYREGQGLDWLPSSVANSDSIRPEDYLEGLLEIKKLAESIYEPLTLEQEILNERREELLEDYHQAQDRSLGLSGNLNLEILSTTPRIEKERNPGIVTLFSGGFGFLIWLIYAFFVVSKGGIRDD